MKRGKQKLKTMVILIITILIITVSFQPTLTYLVAQSGNPTGFVGKIMTVIWSSSFEKLSEWGFTQIRLNDYHTILDVGFGGGSNIKYIRNHHIESKIYGVDISQEAVNTVTNQNSVAVENGELSLSVMSVDNMKFADNQFDLILAEQTHIYWENLDKGLLECYRCLAENGTLLITCEIDKINYHLSAYSNHDDFVKLLYEVGFKNVQVNTNGNFVSFIATK